MRKTTRAYSREFPGRLAAPTASLHFDEIVLDGLRRKGIQMSWITLHVGFGTFMNVRADEIEGDRLHSEWGSITESAASEINNTRERRRKNHPGRHNDITAPGDFGADVS